jgi:hypothetical protein
MHSSHVYKFGLWSDSSLQLYGMELMAGCAGRPGHRVNTRVQWPLSDVHSTVMINSFQADGGGRGCMPPSFTLSTITYKVVVSAPSERGDTLSLFLLYSYMYSVGLATQGKLKAAKYLNDGVSYLSKCTTM